MASTPRPSATAAASPRAAQSTSKRTGSSGSPAQSVRTRLPGGGQAPRFGDDDASGVSSRRVPLAYAFTRVSHEAAAHKAINLFGVPPSKRAPKKRRYWSSTKESGVTMILQMQERCLLSKVVIDNKSISSMSIAIATDNAARKFLHVKKVSTCPHGKVLEVKMGHIPCTYVKFTFHSGTPIAAYTLRLIGMPVPTVLPLLGPTLDTLLVQQTGDILFGSSLPASLPTSFQEYTHTRLPDPHVHLEIDDYDTAPTLLDLILKKNGLMGIEA